MYKLFNTNTKKDIARPVRFFALISVALLIVSGCENPVTGYGPSPNYIDRGQHEPLLNIFGVVRPGEVDGKPLSFVRLEYSYDAKDYPDTFGVADADVKLFLYDGGSIVDSLDFIYSNFDSAFAEFEYRNSGFFPESGKTYGIQCTTAYHPRLSSETTMPDLPVIIDDRITVTQNRLTFVIQRDSLAALYDVEFLVGDYTFTSRVNRPESGDIAVELDFSRGSEHEGLLTIYAYDLNLSEYMTYNITVKPNTYQPPYSTVNNGYGCFGSFNILETAVQF